MPWYRPGVAGKLSLAPANPVCLQVTSASPESILHPFFCSYCPFPSAVRSSLRSPNGALIFSLHAARFVHQYSCSYCFREFDFLVFEWATHIWITTFDHGINFKETENNHFDSFKTFCLRQSFLSFGKKVWAESKLKSFELRFFYSNIISEINCRVISWIRD